MKIFIAIPISDRDETEQREHADLIKAALSKAGHRPVTPFDNYAGKNATYVDHITQHERIIADCDALFLCDGWQFSRGCRIEANFANEFGKQIMYETAPEKDSCYFNR